MGLADTAAGFQGVAYLDIPAGDVGLVSQSGAMGEEFVARALDWGCGFSRYVTLGNQADLTAAEVLAGFAGHEPTRVVALYVEDFVDGRELGAAAAAVTASRSAGRAAGARPQRGRRARRALAHGGPRLELGGGGRAVPRQRRGARRHAARAVRAGRWRCAAARCARAAWP